MADFFNSILFTAFLGWFIAQLLKMIFVLMHDRKLDWTRMIGSGGMPSSHSAFVTSLAMSVGLKDGFYSTTFAIAVVFAVVVMYDAAGIRRAAGQQAQILNRLIEQWNNSETREKQLKELLGHTPVEVFAGAVLGVIIAILRFL